MSLREASSLGSAGQAALTAVRRDLAPASLASAVTVAGVVVYLPGSHEVRMVELAGLAALVAAWVTAVHPRVLLCIFAVVLAVVPYADVPTTNIPVLLVLAVGIWVALPFLPGVEFRPGWVEGGLAIWAAVALLSLIATGISGQAFEEYAGWLAATAVVVPIRLLPADVRASVIRAFVLGAAAASLFGIALLVFDPNGFFLNRLSFIGYSATADNAQRVLGNEVNPLRLTGTFVEPNIAGLVLAVGLLLAVASTRGLWRVLLVSVIGLALLLTLSRSALATVAFAAVVLALVAGGRRRTAVLTGGALAVLGTLAVPTVRERLLDSFGPNDTGSLARWLAFQEFPGSMAGHWDWGNGWAREEFRDFGVGVTVNYIANAPLLTIYRGGLLVGGVAIVLLVAILMRSVVATRRSFHHAVLGSGVIAFVLVSLQLDFPVVTQPPATAAFSFLLGLSLQRVSTGSTTEDGDTTEDEVDP